MEIVERFKKYIAFDTVSDPKSETFPSTKTQIEFAKMLVEDLHELGLENAYLDEFGYIYGRIDANKSQTIGLIAHMDTAPDFVGGCKNPKIVENYDGSDVTLDSNETIFVKDFPFMKYLIGETLMFTDGYHLLGGDDKAGIVIIFDIIEYFLKNKDKMTSNLAICFTPDEEIGLGASKFDVKKMNANIAFTIDGGHINYANYENFNAASAVVKITGLSVHPGSAKNVMINAALLGIEFNNLLPQDMIPSKTEEYEGFIHLCDFNGDVNYCVLEYILRDHDLDLLEKKKEMLEEAKNKILKAYPKAKVELEIKDSYLNMAPYFINHPEAINLINKAFLKSEEKINYVPVRGGTDGATITYMGLPCPNLGDGDFNPHGKFEFVSITQMEKMVQILINMLEI